MPEREPLLLEADRLVEEAQARARASVRATFGPSPIDLWPPDTVVSPITGALSCQHPTTPTLESVDGKDAPLPRD